MADHAEWVHYIGNALITWAAVVGTASVVVHARVRWRETQVGVHLMAYMAAFALVLDLSVIRLLLGDSDWFQMLRLAVFVAVPVAMTQRLWLQIRAQRWPVCDTPPERGH